MEIPITQSEEWQKLQNDLELTTFYEKNDNYCYLAILKKTPVGNYLFLPYGPVLKSPNCVKAALDSLTTLAMKHKAIFIKIEPLDPDTVKYLPKNAKKVKDVDPADTWVLDLTPDKETILHNFEQGTRTRYNTFIKKGLTVETTKNLDSIDYLVRLQSELFEKKHLKSYDAAYLKAELSQPFASLYLVKYHKTAENKDNMPEDGQVLAASLFFDYQGTRFYMQSAADLKYRKLPATVALLTTAIFDAKEKGIKHFDFWGIAPDGADSSHPWYGFTAFKKSFGGTARHYAGTYDIIVNPIKYQIYQKSHQLKKLLH